MELLLAALATGITEIVKLLSNKFGKELSKTIVFGIVFTLVLAGTYSIRTGLVPMELLKQYIAILTEAIGLYHLIVKPVKSALLEQ
ncbi:MAG TPA: hypothetical protein PKZ42_01795 [Syntrophales bacterium]|nr:hypothetical protein [Syntrophales bacterium]